MPAKRWLAVDNFSLGVLGIRQFRDHFYNTDIIFSKLLMYS